MSNEWAEMLKLHEIQPSEADASIMARVKKTSREDLQVVDMSGYSVIEITGQDAPEFLQGQFCNDLKQVTATHAQITGYCTPKGRLLTLPTIVGFDAGFRLLIPQSVKEAFIKRISMFVMRSKVIITELSDVRCMGVIAGGQNNDSLAQSLLGSLPAAAFDASASPSMQVIRWHDDLSDGQRSRFVVIADQQTITDLWNQDVVSVRSGQSAWRLADISAGVPSITGGVVEAFVPQMMNMQLIDGLSFTKGCYPGQEIVARMQYLGKLKRHMRPFKLTLGATTLTDAPVAGAKLSCGADKEAGVIVDAAQMGDEAILILAVVKVSAAEDALQYEDSALASVDLPYELPSLTSDQPDAS
ncbi:hypothetical protein N9850_00590 [Granulosicoccus sp.]|nr:hypothetical protein [Granulosicoccus sp.]MDB4222240.1 hypothetical protein [Granulosicoccus sp.]